MTDLGTQSLSFIEELYEQYQRDPAAVPEQWRGYFEQLDGKEGRRPGDGPRFLIGRDQLRQPDGPGGASCAQCGRTFAMSTLQYRVTEMVRDYRVRGHRIASVNPLAQPAATLPELEPSYYGFVEADLDLEFPAGSLSSKPLALRELMRRLRGTYCGSIGVQFMHIDELAEREWLQERMESSQNRIRLSREQQVRVLTRLTDAVTFERFVQTKFVGAKSFSLEGAESLIPLLDMAIDKAGSQGVRDIVLGMPHRGRLNVLANIMRKHPRKIFSEFKDVHAERFIGRGDVKYHLGYSRELETSVGAMVHLDLMFNPSHLEFANPVALGYGRARQDHRGDREHERGLVILLHGDAAFAGEGIVQESLNLSQLDGYAVGGALHVVINNQIGFTTLPAQARSGTYATDVARMLQVPIFHVNGESPEAVAQAVQLAMDYREEFKHDVVIDMYCYRRRGHNEGDEPRFTQPNLYRDIERRKTVRESYRDHLLEMGELSQEETDRIADDRIEFLQREYERVDNVDMTVQSHDDAVTSSWVHYRGGLDTEVSEPSTGVFRERLSELLEKLGRVPDGFSPHPKIAKLLESRQQMSRGERPLDWGAAEALAFATLAVDGVSVRLAGQDSERGTFSHRHAVLHDVESGAEYAPLQHLAEKQAPVEILNSPLSEGAALGFEYGYSVAGLRRPVSRQCGDQVADTLGLGSVVAARTGRDRPGARQRAVGTFLGFGCHGQLPGRLSDDARAALSLSASSGATSVEKAAHRDGAQEHAAPSGGRLQPGRAGNGPIRALARRCIGAAAAGGKSASLQRQALSRAGCAPGAPGSRTHGHRAARATLPAALARAGETAWSVPGRYPDRLGPGGTGEYGGSAVPVSQVR